MIFEVESTNFVYSIDLTKVAFLERNREENELSIFFLGDSQPLTLNWEQGEAIWQAWQSRHELVQIEQQGGATKFLRLGSVSHATTIEGVLIVYVVGNPEGIFFRGEASLVMQQKLAEHSQKFVVQTLTAQI